MEKERFTNESRESGDVFEPKERETIEKGPLNEGEALLRKLCKEEDGNNLPNTYHVAAEQKALFSLVDDAPDYSNYPIVLRRNASFTALGLEYKDRRLPYQPDIQQEINLANTRSVLKTALQDNPDKDLKAIFQDQNQDWTQKLSDAINSARKTEIFQDNRQKRDEIRAKIAALAAPANNRMEFLYNENWWKTEGEAKYGQGVESGIKKMATDFRGENGVEPPLELIKKWKNRAIRKIEERQDKPDMMSWWKEQTLQECGADIEAEVQKKIKSSEEQRRAEERAKRDIYVNFWWATEGAAKNEKYIKERIEEKKNEVMQKIEEKLSPESVERWRLNAVEKIKKEKMTTEIEPWWEKEGAAENEAYIEKELKRRQDDFLQGKKYDVPPQKIEKWRQDLTNDIKKQKAETWWQQEGKAESEAYIDEEIEKKSMGVLDKLTLLKVEAMRQRKANDIKKQKLDSWWKQEGEAENEAYINREIEEKKANYLQKMNGELPPSEIIEKWRENIISGIKNARMRTEIEPWWKQEGEAENEAYIDSEVEKWSEKILNGVSLKKIEKWRQDLANDIKKQKAETWWQQEGEAENKTFIDDEIERRKARGEAFRNLLSNKTKKWRKNIIRDIKKQKLDSWWEQEGRAKNEARIEEEVKERDKKICNQVSPEKIEEWRQKIIREIKDEKAKNDRNIWENSKLEGASINKVNQALIDDWREDSINREIGKKIKNLFFEKIEDYAQNSDIVTIEDVQKYRNYNGDKRRLTNSIDKTLNDILHNKNDSTIAERKKLYDQLSLAVKEFYRTFSENSRDFLPSDRPAIKEKVEHILEREGIDNNAKGIVQQLEAYEQLVKDFRGLSPKIKFIKQQIFDPDYDERKELMRQLEDIRNDSAQLVSQKTNDTVKDYKDKIVDIAFPSLHGEVDDVLITSTGVTALTNDGKLTTTAISPLNKRITNVFSDVGRNFDEDWRKIWSKQQEEADAVAREVIKDQAFKDAVSLSDDFDKRVRSLFNDNQLTMPLVYDDKNGKIYDSVQEWDVKTLEKLLPDFGGFIKGVSLDVSNRETTLSTTRLEIMRYLSGDAYANNMLLVKGDCELNLREIQKMFSVTDPEKDQKAYARISAELGVSLYSNISSEDRRTFLRMVEPMTNISETGFHKTFQRRISSSSERRSVFARTIFLREFNRYLSGRSLPEMKQFFDGLKKKEAIGQA